MIHPVKDYGNYRKFGFSYNIYRLKDHVNKLEFKDILDKNNSISEIVWSNLNPIQQPCFDKIKMYHCGHDYSCDAGDNDKSIADGKVVFSDEVNGFGSYGSNGGVIIIQHKVNNESFLALHGHIHRFKGVGDFVKEGDVIGEIIEYRNRFWNTNKKKYEDSKTDHLHFCIIVDSVIPSFPWGYRENLIGFFNPIEFINKRK